MEPVQLLTPDTSGNETSAMPDWASLAVALSANEPEPDGRNQSVLESLSKCWAAPPVSAVGESAVSAGGVVSIFAVALGLDGALTFPTLSETR